MKHNIDAILKQYFGFDQFRQGQRQVIDSLLAGHNAAAIFPTGAGKSLCYQLPAICFEGLTVVVSPLIALMKDQIDALKRSNISAARMDSTLSPQEAFQVYDQLSVGEIKILYIAPERFNNEAFRHRMKGVNIELLAIDEAHCISEWGHNFRPDYLKLPYFGAQFQCKRFLALSATATTQALQDICRHFAIDQKDVVRTGCYRNNLILQFCDAQNQDRLYLLLQKIQQRKKGAAIVYVTLQKEAEDVANFLTLNNIIAKAYHAGMQDEARVDVQDWFMQHENAIVVATIAFGMGIDKSNIRYIYHYKLPKSLENYSQEIGRAARDGQNALCEVFVDPKDVTVLENFVYGDTPTTGALDIFLSAVFTGRKELECSLYTLARQSDIKMIVVKTLLTYLELEGYIQARTPVYTQYQFKPLMASAALLKHFEGKTRQLIVAVLSQSISGKIWFKINVEAVANRLKVSRDEIVGILTQLCDKALIELKASGVVNRYQVNRFPDDQTALALSLHRKMSVREAADIRRIYDVLKLASLSSCQYQYLANYFGEVIEPCGHCSWCMNQQVITLQQWQNNKPSYLNHDQNEQIQKLKGTYFKLLNEPIVLARFLSGLNSPQIMAMGLKKHPLFGLLVAVPFKRVLQVVVEEID